jgi:hypothetical protein
MGLHQKSQRRSRKGLAPERRRRTEAEKLLQGTKQARQNWIEPTEQGTVALKEKSNSKNSRIP